MKKNIMVVGAGDAVGARIINDFLKRGYTVSAAILEGQDTTLPETVTSVSLNPLCMESVEEAATTISRTFDAIDMLVVNIDCCPTPDKKTILDTPNYEEMIHAYEYNSLGPLRVIDAFMPLLEKGEGKRICIVTSIDSSNNMTRGIDDYPGHVSKAPLNMAMNQLFNALRPKGYTFRMYCKDMKAIPEKAGEFAAEYFDRNRSYEPESYKHSDENRLVMRDWMGIEVPW